MKFSKSRSDRVICWLSGPRPGLDYEVMVTVASPEMICALLSALGVRLYKFLVSVYLL